MSNCVRPTNCSYRAFSYKHILKSYTYFKNNESLPTHRRNHGPNFIMCQGHDCFSLKDVDIHITCMLYCPRT